MRRGRWCGWITTGSGVGLLSGYAKRCEMESEKVSKVIDIAGKIAGKAEEIDEILVLYCTKDGRTGSMDSNLTVSVVLLLVENFKRWLLEAHAKLHGD